MIKRPSKPSSGELCVIHHSSDCSNINITLPLFNMAFTRLEARYIDRDKLDTLLRKEFGSDYGVEAQGDVIEINASRQLTEAEVQSVTWEY
ncbi:hypothetical protein CEP51_002283 [Fusarium floridanum]|uniref:Uncharacterized protein n=2 Tax=Fusarium solani species complex TaxID=232080 RepID=A0A428SBX9_9HYPO|nr:hypothetical protein CEP51_002283 [Fusarium floridanum]